MPGRLAEVKRIKVLFLDSTLVPERAIHVSVPAFAAGRLRLLTGACANQSVGKRRQNRPENQPEYHRIPTHSTLPFGKISKTVRRPP